MRWNSKWSNNEIHHISGVHPSLRNAADKTVLRGKPAIVTGRKERMELADSHPLLEFNCIFENNAGLG